VKTKACFEHPGGSGRAVIPDLRRRRAKALESRLVSGLMSGLKSGLMSAFSALSLLGAAASWNCAAAQTPPVPAAPAASDRIEQARQSDTESVRALTADGRLLLTRDRVKLDGYAYCSMAVAAAERGDFRLSIEAASRMLVLAQQSDNGNLQALAFRDLSIAYSYAGDLRDARVYAQKALDGKPKDPAQVYAPAHKVLGDVVLREGDANAAIDAYRAALETASPRYRPLVLASLASAQIAAGDTTGARASLAASGGAPAPSLEPFFRRIEGNLLLAEHEPQKALDVFSASLVKPGAEHAEDADYDDLWAHEGMARAWLALGDARQARAALAAAIADSEAMRARFRSDEFKTGLFADVQGVFDLAIGLAMDDQDDEHAWALSEQSRARALLDTVRSRVDAGVNPRQLNGDALTLAQVRNTLRDDETIVEYHALAHRMIAFVVRRDGLTAHVLPIERRDLGSAVDALRAAILDQQASARAYGARLDKLLIEPLGLREHDRLILVPHGVLYYMPFQALRNDEGYLIQRHALALAPSASVAVQLVTRERTLGSHLVAFGNPHFSDRWDLPAAEREVRVITPYFSQSTAWLRDDATRAHFYDSAPNGRVLHVAAHAEADSVDPLYSNIKLAPPEHPPIGPDKLSARDIYKLRLDDVGLVTLSACDTALGRLGLGNEIEGLTRAFFYAGASSVIVSMWMVDDEASALTMSTFYRSLTAGHEAIDAMRDAQLAVLADPRFASPYYWAPFDLTGGWRLTVAR